MNRTLRPLLLSFFFLWSLFYRVQAQQKEAFIDYKPVYKAWSSNYILDKITYTDKNTIFHFRHVAGNFGVTSTFFGPNGSDPWTLVNTANRSEKFKLQKVKNLRVNGVKKFDEISTIPSWSHDSGPQDVITCEVWFPRLPNHIKEVDFIEGIGKETYNNHFHCFKVRLKTFNDPDLGTPEDLQKTLNNFSKTNNIKNQEANNSMKDVATQEKNNPLNQKIHHEEVTKEDTNIETQEVKVVKEPEVKKDPMLESIKAEGLAKKFNPIHFEQSTCKILDESKADLDALASAMKELKTMKIEISGHTDNQGDAQKNQHLSYLRAIVVRNYLLDKGIAENRIVAVGMGAATPVADNSKEELRKQNRRVEIKVLSVD